MVTSTPEYTVIINGEEHPAYSINEVWKIIGESQFGSTYMVYYCGTTDLVEETIPF